MLKMRSFVRAITIAVLAMAGVFSAHAGTMVSITSPIPGTAVQGTATATIHLVAPADPSTLKVQANGVDVTTDFNVSSCSATPCDISATLTTGSGQIISGWNYLSATVQTSQGTADFANVKFQHVVGVSDSTDGSGPPYAVHIWTQPISGTGGIVLFNLSYAPGTGNAGIQYPDSLSQVCGGVELFILSRGVQQPQNSSPAPLSFSDSECVAAGDNATLHSILTSVTKDQMVLVANLPGTALGEMDFSPVGGTNFADPNRVVICTIIPNSAGCVKPYGYTLIGYGQSATGTAYESFSQNAQEAYHPIDGDLVNIGSSATVYGFQTTRAQGFTIVPASVSPNGKSQILVGNMSDQAAQDLTAAELALNTRTVPAGATTSTTYTAPGNLTNGLWLMVLDRHTLALELSQVYDTDNQNVLTFCNAVTQLLTDLQAQNSSSLVMLSSIGTPIANANGVCDATKQGVMSAIGSLGVSAYALNELSQDSFGVPAGGTISLIGIPGNGFLARSSTASGSYEPAHKWWSSTREAQTCSAWIWDDKVTSHPPSTTPCTTNATEAGAIRGILAFDHSMQYQPTSVTAYVPSSVAPDGTADELLNQTASYSIASASIVPWPMLDTPGHQQAYAYLSYQIIAKQIYGSSDCSTNNVCYDVRFYYTGSQAASIANFDPTTLAYPGDGNGFSLADYNAVAAQLKAELSYLNKVQNYENIVENNMLEQQISVGLAISSAATDISTSIGSQLANPPQPLGSSNIQLDSDIFNIASAAASFIPGADELAGIYWVVSAGLQIINDEGNTTQTSGDPYLTTFGDLLAKSGDEASAAALSFNNGLSLSTGNFFDEVYSDWYKLQTLGVLTRSSNATGWYFTDAGKSLNTAYFNAVQSNEQADLVNQILAQDVQVIQAGGVDTEAYIQNGWSQADVDVQVDANLAGHQFGIQTGSGFVRRTSLGLTSCQSYSVPVFTNAKQMLSYAFWTAILSGPGGASSSALSANFLYDIVVPTLGNQNTGPNCGSITSELQYPTVTTIAMGGGSAGSGQSVALTIAVKSSNANATGDLDAPVLIQVNGVTAAILEVPSGTESSATLTYTLDAALLSNGTNTVQVNYAGNGTYEASSASTEITVGAPSFALAAQYTTVGLLSAPGSTISTNVTLTPEFGFNAAVQLSCSGLPAGVACSFDKSQLTVSGEPVSTQVIFTNNGTAQIALDTKQIPSRGLGVLACGLVGLCFLRRRSCLVMLAGLVMIGSFLGGCGTSPSVQNPPAASYTVTINATGGGITQSSKVTLNIQ